MNWTDLRPAYALYVGDGGEIQATPTESWPAMMPQRADAVRLLRQGKPCVVAADDMVAVRHEAGRGEE